MNEALFAELELLTIRAFQAFQDETIFDWFDAEYENTSGILDDVNDYYRGYPYKAKQYGNSPVFQDCTTRHLFGNRTTRRIWIPSLLIIIIHLCVNRNVIMKTSAYKYAISGLMLIAAILSGMLILQVRENRLLRLDLRHVRDVLVRYDAERERALAADIPGTLEHLKRFDVDAPADEMGDRFLRDILVQRRRQITRDLIEDLRRKTGQDYGDTAEEWIRGLKDVRGECF